MHIFDGCVALSKFKLDSLLTKIQALEPSIYSLKAEYLHLVRFKGEVSPHQLQKLKLLLDYGSERYSSPTAGLHLLVAPRPGTISPWSSKAQEVAKNAGINNLERIERVIDYSLKSDSKINHRPSYRQIVDLLHDKMTQSVFDQRADLSQLFATSEPGKLEFIDILSAGKPALQAANQHLGLAMSEDEVDYLYASFKNMGRNPSDAELMMFAQANSEHCRHKIFNATWVIDGKKQRKSLFAMIRNTHQKSPRNTLVAYSDNSSVIAGAIEQHFMLDAKHKNYRYKKLQQHILMKVETHNHPTAIEPFSGAATGAGGEIRDEGATGRGAKVKAGLCGFSVSNLHLPSFPMPWEEPQQQPPRLASALEIMLQAPIGAARYNNEFGRANLCGYFRTYEQTIDNQLRAYHKPIMIAGGMGNVAAENVYKKQLGAGVNIIVLGGKGMQIGLGGGAASSQDTGQSSEDLDFASVQRENPEMQRRCQEVINTCANMGKDNPILSIHDVGAGGLSNAIPELIDDGGVGGLLELGDIPSDEPGMSPMAIWCNESQERYVLAISDDQLELFSSICQRERALFAVVGKTCAQRQLTVRDSEHQQHVVDMPLSVLLGKTPQIIKQVSRLPKQDFAAFEIAQIDVWQLAKRVLHMPAVASKLFLITIGDRSVGGQVVRDQLVGPWQMPVADVAVSASSYNSNHGQAMAMGERAPVALINAQASARMAVAEALTNILAADIEKLGDIKLSANWMAACGTQGEDLALFEAVKAVGLELCPKLGISIPVGKDSLSMQTKWQQDGEQKSAVSPLSLVVSAFAPLKNVRHTLTPQLKVDAKYSLYFIDISAGKARVGASVAAQAYRELGNSVPDVDQPLILAQFLNAIIKSKALISAYHDRSDGGLFVTLAEMAFASRCGLKIDLSALQQRLNSDVNSLLFNEELGVVVQVADVLAADFVANFADENLRPHLYNIGKSCDKQQFTIVSNGQCIIDKPSFKLLRHWSMLSYQMQKLRDNPQLADQEQQSILDPDNQGLHAAYDFELASDKQAAPNIHSGARPKVAILREQGINGYLEMAAAFDLAGFNACDVHMSDLLSNRVDLADFAGAVACGGFSYGDVLGAGGSWAKIILLNPLLRKQFANFFARPDTFALGVCNGCQMLAQIKELIPGAEHFPSFSDNLSAQFESRFVMAEVMESPSLFFKGMHGAKLPIIVAHGEGNAVFKNPSKYQDANIALRYIDSQHQVSEVYPYNPNGSAKGATGFSSADGRVTIMMPHPERAILGMQHSWAPQKWQQYAPWFKMFQNARQFVG